MKSKKGIALEQTMMLILAVVFLVVVLYFFIGKGLVGPVKGQTAELTCTMSSYSRGLLLKALLPLLDSFETVIEGAAAVIVGGASAIVAGVITGPIGFVAGGAAGGAAGAEAAESYAESFSLQFLSSIPMVCPTTTENVGLPGNKATSQELAQELGTRLFDTWRAIGGGSYDPLAGLDPPNPRTVFIIETHLDTSVTFDALITAIRLKNPNNWPFGETTEDTKLYLYCQDKSPYSACNIKDSRIYIMYKDDHNYDKWTAGTNVCGGHINADAREYRQIAGCSSTTMGDQVGCQAIKVGLYDFRADISPFSPWHHARDALVVCVEPIE
jgi:hypothetical protein